MPFPYDKYPWLNFQELNLAYFIKHFREIFQQWDSLLNEMHDWKDATDAELAEWKSTVDTGISSWETGLQQSMEDWKDETEADISTWEAATLSALDAWKTATTVVFEQIRTEAAASAQAAAGSASSAQTALAGAQAAQAAAEAAATGIQSELEQIQTNTADIAELKTHFEQITTEENETVTETSYYTTPWNTGGGINADGDFVAVTSWAYTDKIAVLQGDVITCDALGGSSQRVSRPIRYLCAYNGDTPVPSAGYSREIDTYTVPAGVTHIVATQASYTSYSGQRVLITRTTTTEKLWLKQDKIGGFRQAGNLGSGEEFVFPITNIKEYKVFLFSGNVTSFSSLILGRYVDNAAKESVTIGTTKVTVKNTYGTKTDFNYPTEQAQPSDPPVFTVNQNIQVYITTGNWNRLTGIRVISNGVVFEIKENQLDNITWNADKGHPFVKSDGSTLTDCAASWTSKKMNAPIWIFGDSYMSYDSARWAYYLINDGYDADCLLNAYAGENSQNALVAFNSLVADGKRTKTLVWALGMNDGDSISDDAPNGNWLNTLNSVISVCEERGIELILCTIPTTPSINNNYKNAWIKASGYRYIDFAAGVGATTEGVWFTGLLAQDNVHPTVEGAKTLYYKLLSELPEIVTNN